ncbi:MAG: hypothetical protein LBI14_08225 [Treponema sp.]|jgi:hypothetical protein|nr:hypothetical protein [Treponema sp.]
MVKEKKPTIYSDRGTIGSSDELDEYGVWVKSEPQDLSDSLSDTTPELDADPFGSDTASDTSDIMLPDVDDLPDFGSVESDEEVQNEDAESWEIPDINDIADSDEADSAIIQDIQIDDFEFEPLELPANDTPEQAAEEESVVEEESIEIEESLEIEEDFAEIDVQDEIASEDIAFDEPVDFEESVDLAEPVDFEESADLTASVDFEESADLAESADSSNQDSLDFSGLINEPGPATESSSVKASSSPSPVVSDLSNQLLLRIAEELSSIRAELTSLKKDFAGMKAESQPQEHDHGFFNEEEDETIALTGDELSTILNVEAKDGADTSAVESEASAGFQEAAEAPVAVEAKAAEHGFFDDEDDETIALTGDELNNILNTAEFTEETGTDVSGEEIELPAEDTDTPPMEDFAVEEFQVEELPSEEVPLEIAPLEETPLDELPVAEFSMEEISLEETPTEETFAEDVPVEILAEEEPEMISLDNIGDDLGTGLEEIDLGESGEAEPLEELEDLGEAAVIDLDDTAELDESADLGVTLSESLDLEEFAIPESVENDELPDFGSSAEDDIIDLSETGVVPMTPAPEDTSFLDEEDTTAEAELSLGETVDEIEFEEALDEPTIDLSEAVIDEPDLSLEIQDNPIEEPSLENISIDLDLGESILDEEAEDDISFGTEEVTMDLEEEIDILEGSEEDISISPEVFDLDEEEIAETPTVEASASLAEDEFAMPEAFTGEVDESPIPLDETPDEEIILEDDIFSQEEIPEPKAKAKATPAADTTAIPPHLKQELKAVLSYMDKLLESLPDDKIEEFARSDYFDTYKKLFNELGLI